MDDLRKLAAEVVGRAALEERFGPAPMSALDAVLLTKVAGADPELLKVAETLPGSLLENYEKLGGEYKTAVSAGWVKGMVERGAAKASPERLKKFVSGADAAAGKAIEKNEALTRRAMHAPLGPKQDAAVNSMRHAADSEAKRHQQMMTGIKAMSPDTYHEWVSERRAANT